MIFLHEENDSEMILQHKDSDSVKIQEQENQRSFTSNT